MEWVLWSAGGYEQNGAAWGTSGDQVGLTLTASPRLTTQTLRSACIALVERPPGQVGRQTDRYTDGRADRRTDLRPTLARRDGVGRCQVWWLGAREGGVAGLARLGNKTTQW